MVPIFKKGDPLDPCNFRPICLLSAASKLNAGHLLNRLFDWDSKNAIVFKEQASFRKGKSTIDQVFVLQHLINKFTKASNKYLYAAFIDFSSAFDLVDRDRLWGKLAETNIDKRTPVAYTANALK